MNVKIEVFVVCGKAIIYLLIMESLLNECDKPVLNKPDIVIWGKNGTILTNLSFISPSQ